MIQATKDDVVIKYNKLHADPKQGDTHCTMHIQEKKQHLALLLLIHHVVPPGKTLDLILKKVKHKMADKYNYKYTITDANTNKNVKVKHKMVENMTSSTADALGLSRAILCNDR